MHIAPAPSHRHFTYRFALVLGVCLYLGTTLSWPVKGQNLPQDATTLPMVGTSVGGTQTEGEEDASAQTSQAQSLTVIPPRVGDDFSLKVKPGEQIIKNIQVKNNSQTSISLKTSATDFVIGEDGSTPTALTDSNLSQRWSLASWMVLTPVTQTLLPSQVGQVNVIINVPDDALPGGHYAMVTHQPLVAGMENPQGSAINQKIGTLFYVVIDGVINEEAFVRNFTFPGMSEYGPIPFSLTVENASEVHITPVIAIDIKNMFGTTVETLTLDKKNIFPLSSREYSSSWNTIWGFGKYKAQLTMSYGSHGQIVRQTTDFWILPMKIILACIVILLVMLASIISIRRHLLHKQSDQQQKITQLETELRKLKNTKE